MVVSTVWYLLTPSLSRMRYQKGQGLQEQEEGVRRWQTLVVLVNWKGGKAVGVVRLSA